jgi:hypothetical protein
MVDVVGEKTPTTASNGCGSFISILMKAARSLNNLNTSSGKTASDGCEAVFGGISE